MGEVRFGLSCGRLDLRSVNIYSNATRHTGKMYRIQYCSGNSAGLAPSRGARGVVLMVNRSLWLLAGHVNGLDRRTGHVVDVGLGFGVHC